MSRPFAEVFREFEEHHEDASDKLAEVVEAVIRTGKKGEITLKIVMIKNGENSVKIDAECKAKVPEANIGSMIFFVEGSGGLRRDNPNQIKMDLRPVQTPKLKDEKNG